MVPGPKVFDFLKRRLALRRRVEIRAQALIDRHGNEAWSLVYSKSRDHSLNDEDRRFYYLVRDRIERKLGIPPRVDTATRYLERD